MYKALDIKSQPFIIGRSAFLNKDIKQQCDILTSTVIRDTITTLTSIKEKSINIFNENSYFLIWRYVDAPPESDVNKDADTKHDTEDYGWYILRNCSLDVREKIISEKIPDDDTIIMESVEDNNGDQIDIMITKTTMKEQETKSYYSGGTYLDCILFPEEKVSMMFELINTPQSSLTKEEKEEHEIKNK